MFTNHKSLQYLLDQKELNARPRRLFSDYDCKIRYHLAKANVAANALSRKERAKPLKVGALVMTINSNLPPQIHEAQVEALKKENVKNENLPDTNKDFETRLDRTLCIRSRNCHEFYHKPVKDNKLLLHDLGNHDHQKNYADVRRKPLEFQVGVGTVAYRLEFSQQTSGVHSTILVSNLKECSSNETLVIPLDEIQIDDKLHFIEEPVEIMDREAKRIRQSHIPIIKVHWNSRRGLEFI
ncbi:hypothetical protein Tco_0773034 [Tanacetum coccineum]|uniref:Reverse transcriptase domain-containing protein n=1 Tax=Tanacetum coccineum TaxID=301880 RepID=A0ABQ4ZNM9_9ASTR